MSTDNKLDFNTMLASSIHDMKNSLSMLLSSIDDLSQELPAQTPQQQQRYAVLNSESLRIRNQLMHLLELYRLDQGLVNLKLEQVFVAEFLEHQVAINESVLSSAEIELELDCDTDLVAYCDQELVGSVINNVLVNACRYANKRLSLSARADGAGICIALQDDGPGFPDAMLFAAIEQPQLEKSHIESTQLGLYFAQRIAALHQNQGQSGRIAISNRCDEQGISGGCFELYLP